MDARAITKALGGRWARSYGLARCPVHADKTPSLKVRDDARKSDGIDVVCFAGCDWKDIKNEFRRQGLLPQVYQRPKQDPYALLLHTPLLRDVAPRPVMQEPHNDNEKRAEAGLKMWDASVSLNGTVGWRYLTEKRGIDIAGLGDISHALRWHKVFYAVVALMTDAVTGEPCGIHRTFLKTDGIKRERKMLGRQGVVRLSPDEDVTQGLGIAEGIEDGLAILSSGWAPVWAATSAGAIERFPVLAGIEHLTIFADNDEAGTRAAQACAERWTAAGQETFIARLT